MKRRLYKIYLFIMQKWLIIPIIVAVLVGGTYLATGFTRYPDSAMDGAAWDRSWEMLGTVLGVEGAPEGFRLLNNDTVLAGDDTYYASWVSGEATDYTNAEGKPVDLYPAQIYLLLYGCADEDAAGEALTDWTARQEAVYDVLSREEAAFNGQPYSLMTYNCGSDTNPYSHGASGASRLGKYVVFAELTCTDAFQGDARQLLGNFLARCHYGAAR